MVEEPTNQVMSALGIETMHILEKYVRTVVSKLNDRKVLHLYEHKTKSYSVHGHDNINLSVSLLPVGSHTPTELPSTNVQPGGVPTLLLDAATARNLTASALFSDGCKVVVWTVFGDGRVNCLMEGTPGCPGSLTEWLGERADDGVVLSARPVTKGGMLTLGLACWDPSCVCLRVTDVVLDNGHQDLGILETVCVSTNAREVIIPDDVTSFEMSKIEECTSKCNVALTTRKKKTFNASDIVVTIARLCGKQLQNDSMVDGKVCGEATASLLDYSDLTNDMAIEGKLDIKTLSIASYMQLDNCVMRALNILPFPGDGGKKACLFGILNKCKSGMGSKLLKKWLAQPLQSKDDINDRLDVVDLFVNAPDSRRVIRDDHLSKMPDLYALCRRFTRDNGKRASMENVVRLYQCAIRIPILCNELETLSNSNGDSNMNNSNVLTKRFAQPLQDLCKELANFEALVEMTIDLEKISVGEFVVAPSVDPELGRLKSQQDEVMSDISSEYDHVKYELGDTLKLERKDNLGYFFRLTRKEERMIRGKNKYMVIETRKDGVRFQTIDLRRHSRKYEGIAADYSEKEKNMREKTLQVAGTYVEVFMDVAALLAQLDVLTAFATVATESRAVYNRPVITPQGSGLVLQQARHPIVEENLPDDMEYIANDIDLRRQKKKKDMSDSDDVTMTESNENEKGDGNDDGGSLVLVTGPNMGGKSTYIRSAGVLTLMAHIGMFVPAEYAEIPLTDRIFARVGAADNQHRAVSTFMSEMLETASILKNATKNSLVIIDELGRGTGTTDGFGLACAISKHIATELRSACLFATHFYELTSLAEELPEAVYNKHVTAVTNKNHGNGEGGGEGLTFLYEVRDGACDQSFGVHVAEMAKFPAEVVNAARKKAKEMESDVRMSDDIGEEEREEGINLLLKFEEDLNKLPKGTEEEVNESVSKLREMKQQLKKSGNRYVDVVLKGTC